MEFKPFEHLTFIFFGRWERIPEFSFKDDVTNYVIPPTMDNFELSGLKSWHLYIKHQFGIMENVSLSECATLCTLGSGKTFIYACVVKTETKQVSSMIPMARPTVPPLVIIIFRRSLFCFAM